MQLLVGEGVELRFLRSSTASQEHKVPKRIAEFRARFRGVHVVVTVPTAAPFHSLRVNPLKRAGLAVGKGFPVLTQGFLILKKEILQVIPLRKPDVVTGAVVEQSLNVLLELRLTVKLARLVPDVAAQLTKR